ncbi:hypothetical protein DV515_00002831, partial [Chloebia gouldiae]
CVGASYMDSGGVCTKTVTQFQLVLNISVVTSRAKRMVISSRGGERPEARFVPGSLTLLGDAKRLAWKFL